MTTATPAPRHPTRDLLTRYQAVFQAAWQQRQALAGPTGCSMPFSA